MILGDFGDSGGGFIGASRREGYGLARPRNSIYGESLGFNSQLPVFNLRGGSATARALDNNEQSRSTSASIAVDAAVSGVFAKARNAKYSINVADYGLRRSLGPAAFAPGQNQSLPQRMNVRSAAESIVKAGPGFVPPSPFDYRTRAGVPGAEPSFFRGFSAPISGSIQTRGASKAQIRRGE